MLECGAAALLCPTPASIVVMTTLNLSRKFSRHLAGAGDLETPGRGGEAAARLLPGAEIEESC